MSMTHDTTICHDCGGEGVIETTIGGDGDPSEAARAIAETVVAIAFGIDRRCPACREVGCAGPAAPYEQGGCEPSEYDDEAEHEAESAHQADHGPGRW